MTTPRSPRRELRDVQARTRLLEARMRLEHLERQANRGKKLNDGDRDRIRRTFTESQESWEWVGAYQEVIDRLSGPDRDMLMPVSTYSDRRYGANWPFWRTWLEHARIRAGARLLCTLTPLAAGVLRGLCNYVVGAGFTYAAKPKKKVTNVPPQLVQAVQQAIDDFDELNEWGLLERELFMTSRRDGEAFWRFFPDDDGMLLLRQVLPEQVMEPVGSKPATDSFGIYNAPEDLLTITGYNVCLDGDASHAEDVDPAEMVHVKLNVDRMVKRGLSDFSFDTYDTLRGAQRLLENLSEGAAIQASIALIRQHDQAVQSEVQGFVTANQDYAEPSSEGGSDRPVSRYFPGRIEDIPKGQEYVEPPFGANAANYVAVMQAVLRSVAVRWNAPEWIISGDASNNNYSSSITAESPFVKSCKAEQSLYLPAFRRTVREAVKARCDAGKLRCLGRSWSWEEVRALVDVECTPPTVEVRDKDKEAQANRLRVDGGWKSVQQCAAEEGLDWDDVVRDRKAYDREFPQQGPAGPGLAGQGAPGVPGVQAPAPVRESRLTENFTGVDAHGHKWVDGKQVEKDEGGSGAKRPKPAGDLYKPPRNPPPPPSEADRPKIEAERGRFLRDVLNSEPVTMEDVDALMGPPAADVVSLAYTIAAMHAGDRAEVTLARSKRASDPGAIEIVRTAPDRLSKSGAGAQLVLSLRTSTDGRLQVGVPGAASKTLLSGANGAYDMEQASHLVHRLLGGATFGPYAGLRAPREVRSKFDRKGDRIRESKDASGHEHAADGRFGTGGGAAASPARQQYEKDLDAHKAAVAAHQGRGERRTQQRQALATVDDSANHIGYSDADRGLVDARHAVDDASEASKLTTPEARKEFAGVAVGHAGKAAAVMGTLADRLAGSLEAAGGDAAKLRAVALKGRAAVVKAGAKVEAAVGKHLEALAKVDAARQTAAEAATALGAHEDAEPQESDPPDEPQEPGPEYDPALSPAAWGEAVADWQDAHPEEMARHEQEHARWEEDAESLEKQHEQAHDRWEKDGERLEKQRDRADEKADAADEKTSDTETAVGEALDGVDETYSEWGDRINDAATDASLDAEQALDREEAADDEPEEPEDPEEEEEPEKDEDEDGID